MCSPPSRLATRPTGVAWVEFSWENGNTFLGATSSATAEGGFVGGIAQRFFWGKKKAMFRNDFLGIHFLDQNSRLLLSEVYSLAP